jgi:hypothetical protein
LSLAYQVVGEGPEDLMLVSGFLSNIEYAWLYPSLAGFLARLASFSRLILMDRDLTAGSGLTFKDAGEHRLKGFEQPWQLYVASTSANPATAPADEHG